jgi:hypothetical protein
VSWDTWMQGLRRDSHEMLVERKKLWDRVRWEITGSSVRERCSVSCPNLPASGKISKTNLAFSGRELRLQKLPSDSL